MTDDLIAFLRARFDEDQAVAQRASDDLGHVLHQVEYNDSAVEADERHIARHDPARILAEVEAKRRMIDDLVSAWEAANPGMIEQHLLQHRGPSVLIDPETGEEETHGEWTVTRYLRLLGLPYATHPHYRDEWRP